jgi:hypothetical protein
LVSGTIKASYVQGLWRSVASAMGLIPIFALIVLVGILVMT